MYKTILELSNEDAKHFFLKQESYCNIDLPKYINFSNILENICNILEKKTKYNFKKSKDIYGVNHTIFSNKDGKYSWRPLELIHPVLYVNLVLKITDPDNWKVILNRFREFQTNKKIKCMSIPVNSLGRINNKASQINKWWDGIEQESLRLSLIYKYISHSDITDCYSSIYTHSIAWAIHGKEVAKTNRRCTTLIGNIIDKNIQGMRHGQTNGIPQGSNLMDFIAEMVLGYIDAELTEKIKDIKDYHILRYRDDYRIFANNSNDSEKILMCLTEVLLGLGLKLNVNKTRISDSIIEDSFKPDKLYWIISKNYENNKQKHLLIIYNHSIKFPNSGSLQRALLDFYKKIVNIKKSNKKDIEPLIAIISDIALRNPRTYHIVSAILSKFISFISEDERENIIKKVKNKFSEIPNTRYMDIWLQRIVINFDFHKHIDFKEPLCQVIKNKICLIKNDIHIWNNEFINKEYKELIDIINTNAIVDEKIIKETELIIPVKELSIFPEY